MLTYYLIGAALLIVLAARFLRGTKPRCPECGLPRENDHPICECGWVFEYPDDELPIEYGDPESSEWQEER